MHRFSRLTCRKRSIRINSNNRDTCQGCSFLTVVSTSCMAHYEKGRRKKKRDKIIIFTHRQRSTVSSLIGRLPDPRRQTSNRVHVICVPLIFFFFVFFLRSACITRGVLFRALIKTNPNPSITHDGTRTQNSSPFSLNSLATTTPSRNAMPLMHNIVSPSPFHHPQRAALSLARACAVHHTPSNREGPTRHRAYNTVRGSRVNPPKHNTS